MKTEEAQYLVNRVQSVLSQAAITTRKMFGGTTFLLNSNMVCCVSAKGLMVRVGREAEAMALESPHAKPCLGTGRPMAGFIMVDLEGAMNDTDLKYWLRLCRSYVETLPHNSGKTRARRSREAPLNSKRRN
jgi:TfoX/Sxy family transcriptional regulator of competence genes